MPTYQWKAVCQDCGATGNSGTTPNQNPPPGKPTVPGKCKSHASGNPNMDHRAKWEQR